MKAALARSVLLKLVSGLLVAWGSATVAFLALHALPGEVQDILAGDLDYPGLSEAIAAEWGLDRSLAWQYWNFVSNIFSGNLGTSYTLRQPVSEVLFSQLAPTVLLAGTAGVLAFVLALAVALGTSGAGRLGRGCAELLERFSVSVPVFWLGLLLLMALSFGLNWFPVSGGDGWRSLVLPAITLALPTAGLLSQVLREALDKALEQPFVVTLRARGLSEGGIRLRHVLRHAVAPAMTLGGWLIGGLLGGAVLTEKVFGRPGLGTVTLNAVLTHDVPIVLAVVLLAAFVHVVASTALDILYLFIDPRLRTQ
ncbi:ABC transporter permease [Bordetella tumulicola]|uniref:ABC transporter permease n=1 Tax=Bordetella tumulicola TaxID=1649133 RepID=UPI0039F13DB1